MAKIDFSIPQKVYNAMSEGQRLKTDAVLERRIRNGQSFASIAKDMDLSVAYVYKLYRTALNRMPAEKVDTLRKGENYKLDELERECISIRDAVTPLVSAGRVVRDVMRDETGQVILDDDGQPVYQALRDLGPWMQSVEKRLQIYKRRAMLNGLDMPTKVAMTDPTGEEAAEVIQFYLPRNGRE